MRRSTAPAASPSPRSTSLSLSPVPGRTHGRRGDLAHLGLAMDEDDDAGVVQGVPAMLWRGGCLPRAARAAAARQQPAAAKTTARVHLQTSARTTMSGRL